LMIISRMLTDEDTLILKTRMLSNDVNT